MSASFDPAVYRGVRVVVLGGGGFIGRHVVDRLVAYGAAPILLTRSKPRLYASWRGRVVVYDEPITSLKAVSEALANCFAFNEAAVVINLAAAGVLPGKRDGNAMSAANGLLAETVATTTGELCAELPAAWPGVSLLHVGSALEYGTRAQNLDEAAKASPDEPYGRSKLRGTEAVLRARAEHGLSALVVRPFTVFGPGEPASRLLSTLISRAGDDRPIELSAGTQSRDIAYVEDVAEGIVRLAASPRKAVAKGEGPFDAGVINLATGTSVSIKDFVLAAAKEFFLDEGRLRFGALPPRDDDTDHPPTPIARLAAATGGFALNADPAAGLRRTHRRLLASLYEPAPQADEKAKEPARGRDGSDPEQGPGGKSDRRAQEGRTERRSDRRPDAPNAPNQGRSDGRGNRDSAGDRGGRPDRRPRQDRPQGQNRPARAERPPRPPETPAPEAGPVEPPPNPV